MVLDKVACVVNGRPSNTASMTTNTTSTTNSNTSADSLTNSNNETPSPTNGATADLEKKNLPHSSHGRSFFAITTNCL
jgi:hypothetical protein